MLNFVPNIVVLDYLNNLKKVDPVLESKAKNFMEMGYQKELSYKHDDGSYSAFGKSDKSGSTWLTAFVVKSFNQAKKYIQIEGSIICKALEWLKTQQKSDGSFTEVGEVFHKEMQGGSSGPTTLTAYVLIAFLENKENATEYNETIKKAIEYIVQNLINVKDPYSLAIAAYALQLATHNSKKVILEKLNNMSENTSDMKFWQKAVEKKEKETCCYHKNESNSINIEMTAYSLLAFTEASMDSEAIQIMKWLVSQRNDQGGFHSTQDTVVGLQALSKLAQKICIRDSAINLTFETNDKHDGQFSIKNENCLVLQKLQLSSETKSVNIKASGNGFAIAQVSYKFNVTDIEKSPRFNIDTKVIKLKNLENIEISLATCFIPDENTRVSNMAVMETCFPSGYIFDSDSLVQLETSKRVKVRYLIFFKNKSLFLYNFR
jgi:CD109 antigen